MRSSASITRALHATSLNLIVPSLRLQASRSTRCLHQRASPSLLRTGTNSTIRARLLRLIRHPRRSYGAASSSPTPNPTPNLGSPASLSLSQRLRKLSREYGWSALGVYLALSALDFPFCFIAVRWLGTERIGHWEHVVVEWVKGMIPFSLPSARGKQVEEQKVEGPVDGAVVAVEGWGVDEAEKASKEPGASIWTQLALAYAIHKSFIFIRVPITAAVTPKVVKTLRGWGWNIGKRTPKASTS